MGIHKLLTYVKSTSEIHFPQFESKNNIYISNVIYFDMTYKLIEIYNQFMKLEDLNNYGNISTESDTSIINRMFKYVARELNNLFSKLINYNRAIYVFIDYKFPDAEIAYNLLFKDFVNLSVDKRERLNCIPMIRRDVIDSLLITNLTTNTNDGSISSTNNDLDVSIIDGVRCLFELTNKNDKLSGVDVQQYISLPALLKRNSENIPVYEKIQKLINVGKYRYMILRGAKYMTKKRRANRMFGFFDKDEYVENNLNLTLINVLRKGNIDKVKRFNHYIPFSLVLYALPVIINMIKTKGVYYMGCEIESDFAIAKHVRTYAKHSFPTIYTTDSDLLVLLSDIDCIVKMNGGGTKKPYLINPVQFWKHIFGCQLSPKIIKILCVLLGTDYNPYHQDSPIHIKSFKDILSPDWLNIKTYNEIDEDILLVKIYMKMNEHKTSRFVQQTAAALNIYLNDIEKNFHYINNIETETLDINKFLKYFRDSWFIKSLH